MWTLEDIFPVAGILFVLLYAAWLLFPHFREKRRWRTIAWALAAVVIAASVLGLGWLLPHLYREAADPAKLEGVKVQLEVVKTVATIVGGLFLFVGGYFTWRRLRATERTVEVSLEGQITDRFTKAIAQLGDEKMEVRLGGIYALERIAWDSERDHWPIMEVLTAFIRENAPWPPRESGATAPSSEVSQCLAIIARLVQPEAPAAGVDAGDTAAADPESIPPLAPDAAPAQASSAFPDTAEAEIKPHTDVQAALTVIGRRKQEHRQAETNLDFQASDLRGAYILEALLEDALLYDANLQGAFLWQANLQRAFLSNANLRRANLQKANLQGAKLWFAKLQGAKLWGANLQGAELTGANLQGAELFGANLQGAELTRANLEGTIFGECQGQKTQLQGADLTEVFGLTWDQLQKAEIDAHTKLPDYLSTQKPEPGEESS